MDKYKELLESLGIFDHGIEIEPKNLRIEIDETWYEEPHFVLDYQQEKNAKSNLKKIHRYSRIERFRSTLYQLLGIRGNVPDIVIFKIVQTIKNKKFKLEKSKIWNLIRSILKENNLNSYYNRIPSIIKILTGLKPSIENSNIIKNIFDEFFIMNYKFNNFLNEKWKRPYFLNLRFVAFKLIEKYGISYPYKIQKLRTYRRLKYLNNLYEDFYMY